MSEYTLIINYALADKTFTLEEENPCVSITEDLSGTDTDCDGGAVGVFAAMLNWIQGGDLSTEDTTGDDTRIYSSALVVQDFTGDGYELQAVGGTLGDKKQEQQEITETVDIEPGDSVDGVVDLSQLTEKISDKILACSLSGTALDEGFNKNYGFAFTRSGSELTISAPAYASFSVRYLASVDTYDFKDSGESGYTAIVYSVGACGRIDEYETSAPPCFIDDLYKKYGYPWGQDGYDGDGDGEVAKPEPEAEQQDISIVYDFCTKELISCDPAGIVPDGSCWGDGKCPSDET